MDGLSAPPHVTGANTPVEGVTIDGELSLLTKFETDMFADIPVTAAV